MGDGELGGKRDFSSQKGCKACLDEEKESSLFELRNSVWGKAPDLTRVLEEGFGLASGGSWVEGNELGLFKGRQALGESARLGQGDGKKGLALAGGGKSG